MRLPRSVRERGAKIKNKKSAEGVKIFKEVNTALEEFGVTESDNQIQCYVKVSPGDILTLGYEIPWVAFQILDVLVDGVLRESIISNRSGHTQHGVISKVCACEIRPSGGKGKLEYCDMVVEDRNNCHDVPSSDPEFGKLRSSAVGTIELRVLREISSATASDKDVVPEQTNRGATFEDSLRWWKASKRVDSGAIAPKYQIGFSNGKKTHGSSRKNVNQRIDGYYLWAAFKFHYRSAADIQGAGFDKVKDTPNSLSNSTTARPNNPTRSMGNERPAPAVSDKQPFLSSNPAHKLSTDQADSILRQPPIAATGRGLPGNATTGYAKITKGEPEAKASNQRTKFTDGAPTVVDTDLRASELTGNQRSLQAYCESYDGDDEVEEKQEPQGNSISEYANKRSGDRKISTKQDVPTKPFLHAPRRATGTKDHMTAASAEGTDMTDTQGADSSIPLSGPKDTSGNNMIDAKTYKGHSGPSYCHHGGNEEVTPLSDSEHLGDVTWPPLSSSFPRMGTDGAEINQKLGLADLHWVPKVPRTALDSITRAKDGHYVARSLLVGEDADELERHAKAMADGKGDWKGRASGLFQTLGAPIRDRVSAEESSTKNGHQPSTAQDAVRGASPNFAVETFKKRKLEDFKPEIPDSSPVLSSQPSPIADLRTLRLSPKARRDELARRKRAKQEALEVARTEAERLRRQVQEIEAGEAEAIAREEAELDKMDMELEITKEESQVLAARLREFYEQ